jgi:hypothetical protein
MEVTAIVKANKYRPFFGLKTCRARWQFMSKNSGVYRVSGHEQAV